MTIRVPPPFRAACQRRSGFWPTGATMPTGIRDASKDKGIRPCIPGRKTRGEPVKHDKRRNRIEIMFGRLKDGHRVASRMGAFGGRRGCSPPSASCSGEGVCAKSWHRRQDRPDRCRTHCPLLCLPTRSGPYASCRKSSPSQSLDVQKRATGLKCANGCLPTGVSINVIEAERGRLLDADSHPVRRPGCER